MDWASIEGADATFHVETDLGTLIVGGGGPDAYNEEDHGEVLPHLLFGDLTRFLLRAHSRGQGDVVDRCVRFLERAARYGDEMVVELVAVSFVENVGPWEPEMSGFISTWPARLQEIATEQGWSALEAD